MQQVISFIFPHWNWFHQKAGVKNLKGAGVFREILNLNVVVVFFSHVVVFFFIGIFIGRWEKEKTEKK